MEHHLAGCDRDPSTRCRGRRSTGASRDGHRLRRRGGAPCRAIPVPCLADRRGGIGRPRDGAGRRHGRAARPVPARAGVSDARALAARARRRRARRRRQRGAHRGNGIAQSNIRRIAVCAVASELGLGLAALGMGGFSPGVFIAFTSMFTSTLLMLAVGNVIRVYKTDDITEMGGAWPKLRTTSTALGAWALLAGGLGLSSYYALSSAFSGADPAGGVFSGTERTVITISSSSRRGGRAARRPVLITVTRGAVTRRRGFQHDRIADVEPGMRRPLWLAMVAAVVAVLVGLPGLQPFDLGAGSRTDVLALRVLRESSPGDRLRRNRACWSRSWRSRPASAWPSSCIRLRGVRTPRADSTRGRFACSRRLLRRMGDAGGGCAAARRRRTRVGLRHAGDRAAHLRWGRASTLPQPDSARSATRGSGDTSPARSWYRGARVAVSAGGNREPLGAHRMNVILSSIIWTPLLFAVIALFLPERDDEQRGRVRTVALAGAGLASSSAPSSRSSDRSASARAAASRPRTRSRMRGSGRSSSTRITTSPPTA